MKPEFQPIRFTIVDFTASFLPGVVWFILLLTLINLPIFNKQAGITTPVDIVPKILAITFLTSTYTSILFSAVMTIMVFILGYIMNQVGTDIPESLCFLDATWKSKLNKTDQREYHFPYNFAFRPKPFFARIVSSLNTYIQEDFTAIPGKQPYSSCKRILRVISPELWEECEHEEAESRMIGSLFTASIFSFICASLALVTTSPTLVPQILWLLISLLITLLLGFEFRNKRMREVAYTYLNFLIAVGMEKQARQIGNKAKINRGKA
jgi:hypothetical protein